MGRGSSLRLAAQSKQLAKKRKLRTIPHDTRTTAARFLATANNHNFPVVLNWRGTPRSSQQPAASGLLGRRVEQASKEAQQYCG
jgi:hypothetical protein